LADEAAGESPQVRRIVVIRDRRYLLLAGCRGTLVLSPA